MEHPFPDLHYLTVLYFYRGRNARGWCANGMKTHPQPYGLRLHFHGISHGLKFARQLSNFAPVRGLAPAFRFPSAPNNKSTPPGVLCYLEQGTGIEPAFTAWEAVVLPIYEPCILGYCSISKWKIQPLSVESFSSSRLFVFLRWTKMLFALEWTNEFCKKGLFQGNCG